MDGTVGGFCTTIDLSILDDVEDLRRRVARRLIDLRTARGWSQEELGAKAGLSYKFIGEVERSQKSPSLDSLGRIADGLGVDILELFWSEDSARPYPELPADQLAVVREAVASLERVLARAPQSRRRRR